MIKVANEILKEIEKRKLTKTKEIGKLKAEIAQKYKLKQVPKQIHLFLAADEKQRKKYAKLLITKPIRTSSGVAPIAIFTTPLKCPPQAKCIYCPGGPASHFGNVPKSYTGSEPASRRASRNKYDPYPQIFNRLEHYALLNQNHDKVEIIIMGGTFPFYPKKYKEKFITQTFQALNDFSNLFYKNNKFNFKKFMKFFELPADLNSKSRTKKIHQKLLKIKNKRKTTLEKEQIKNQSSKIRCIALVIETRPDYGKQEQGNEALKYGATRIELGIQSVYDQDLKKVKRGHTAKDSKESIQILKDLGFKVSIHYMLGLTENRKKDLEGFKKVFSDPDFRPDMIKIYPCLVMSGTELYKKWKQKKYKPITVHEAANLIAQAKKFIPEYIRIQRVQRDIPSTVISSGPIKTNLRQDVEKICKEKNITCKCIRCREPRGKEINTKSAKIKIKEYKASKGKEFFISYETKDHILGFCRLRFPSQCLRKEITPETSLLRELHVYGPAVEIGKKGSIQHKGLGKKLMKKAEEISLKNKKTKIVVISGIGVKNYYKKLKYKKEGPYMSKKLRYT